jgi:alpha-tubulin suppressor-like RCC1 family protein
MGVALLRQEGGSETRPYARTLTSWERQLQRRRRKGKIVLLRRAGRCYETRGAGNRGQLQDARARVVAHWDQAPAANE